MIRSEARQCGFRDFDMIHDDITTDKDMVDPSDGKTTEERANPPITHLAGFDIFKSRAELAAYR